MNLNGKKILFLSPHFFGYEKAIVTRLKELGAEVDFFNERPSNSVFSRGIIRVKSSLYQAKINKYYKNILNQIKGKNYDFLLLIKGNLFNLAKSLLISLLPDAILPELAPNCLKTV